MRRISLWVLSTLSILILLFGYHTSTSGAQPSSSPTSIYSSSGGSTTPAPTQAAGPTTPATPATPATRTVTGSVTHTRWGPVQVQLKVSGKKISTVSVIRFPTGNSDDQEINSRALPILTRETVTAQSAHIDMVSGATVTSGGYLQSLQSALDQAGL